MLKKTMAVLAVIFCSGWSFAAHPLITDDTGSQGKGKFLLEVNSEFSFDKERAEGLTTKETGGEVANLLSYGITENVDIVLGFPYQWAKTKGDEETLSDIDGISDVSLEAKWRFAEKDGGSFALKPGIILPTGDEKKGLGNGRPSYAFTFITTKEIGPWAIHLNLGYTRNRYKLREDKENHRKDIWHLSLAGEVEVIRNLKAVANIGIERNFNKESNRHPAFVLGGIICSILKNLDIDFGVKGGLNKPETDYSILLGTAFRF
jgi:Putative MetA-pathway of phenol degradation